MPLLGIEAVPGRPSSAHFARFVVRFLLQDLHSGITSIKVKLSDYAGCGSLPASLERLLLGRIEADIIFFAQRSARWKALDEILEDPHTATPFWKQPRWLLRKRAVGPASA